MTELLNTDRENGLAKMTLEEVRLAKRMRLAELIDSIGGKQSTLAAMLGITKQAIVGWNNDGQISKKSAKFIEQSDDFDAKFTIEYLLPDLGYLSHDESLFNDNKLLWESNAKLQELVDSLTSDLEAMTSKIADSEAEVEWLKGDVTETETRLKKTILDLERQVSTLDTESGRLYGRIAELGS